MIRHVCDYCGVFFDEPVCHTYTEKMHGMPRSYVEEACPICGCDSFSAANYCPKCKNPKHAGDRLCRDCRKALLERVCSFADELTAEEEQQFDDWMDGDSIENRRKWK
jgi:hypothetical protein